MANFIPIETVTQQIVDAQRAGRPYSLIRLGDGENAVLSAVLGDEYRELAWVAQGDHRYCGVVPPNPKAAAELIHAIRHADMVGVLYQGVNKWYRPMTQQLFGALQLYPKQITYAYNNLALAEQKGYLELIHSSKIVIVGRLADSLAEYLKPFGVPVVATLMTSWYDDVDPLLTQLGAIDFDVCLACCGVNADIISQQVAERYGKIGIDFGSAANCLVHGTVHLHRG